MTYSITYRQFKRGRRSIHKLPMQAISIQDVRIKFLKTINLAQKLQKYHPFNCNHVHIVSIFEEVASDGQN